MGYFPGVFPAVAPTLDDRPFWQFCAARRLCFQRCADCSRYRHPPGPICPRCQSANVEWGEAPAVGRIFSFTIVHHAHPMAQAVAPYNVALIEFAERDGVRLVSNVVDAAPDELAVGREVALAWDQDGGGQWLPRFRLLAAPPGTRDR
jgi:uncharacterized OB-fold protein